MLGRHNAMVDFTSMYIVPLNSILTFNLQLEVMFIRFGINIKQYEKPCIYISAIEKLLPLFSTLDLFCNKNSVLISILAGIKLN